MFEFELQARSGRARAGRFTTPHGDLLTPVFARSVAVDDVNVYWSSVVVGDWNLYGRPLAGGPTFLLAADVTAFSISTDGQFVYYHDVGCQCIGKVPVGGGPKTTMATGVVEVFNIVNDDKAVYWTDDKTGTVGKVAK